MKSQQYQVGQEFISKAGTKIKIIDKHWHQDKFEGYYRYVMRFGRINPSPKYTDESINFALKMKLFTLVN